MHTLLNWLYGVGPCFLLVSVGVALLRYRYLTGYLRYVGWFIALAALGELISQVTARVLHVPNLYLLHTYTILEFNVIALFYYHFFGSFYPRWLVPGLMVGYTLLAVLNSLFLQPVSGSNSYARGLEAMLIIALSLCCFYQMLAQLTTKRLDRNPVFWINTGFLLYFAGSLFFLMMGSLLFVDSNRTFRLAVFGLHVLLMILMHLLISVGLWFSPRSR